MIQVITFTCTFTNTRKYGNPTMFLCDIVDQFLNRYRFTNTRTTEESDFTTLLVWSKKIDYFNPCLKHFCLCRQFVEAWSFTVDRSLVFRGNFSSLVNRLS